MNPASILIPVTKARNSVYRNNEPVSILPLASLIQCIDYFWYLRRGHLHGFGARHSFHLPRVLILNEQRAPIDLLLHHFLLTHRFILPRRATPCQPILRSRMSESVLDKPRSLCYNSLYSNKEPPMSRFLSRLGLRLCGSPLHRLPGFLFRPLFRLGLWLSCRK
jgi:hypothetical protein